MKSHTEYLVFETRKRKEMVHYETTLPVTNGKLDLGTWQRVFYAEFDGRRPKRVIVKVLGVG